MYTSLYMALISGIILGFWDIFKKKGLESNSTLHVLAYYSLFSFLMISYDLPNALHTAPMDVFILFIKSVIVFFSWLMGFVAIKNLPISISTSFETVVPIFSIIMGIIFLNERLGFLQIAGIAIMLLAYFYIGKAGSSEVSGLFRNKYFYLIAGSSFLGAVSSMIDKIILARINSGQMQFWFMLFVTILYFVTISYYKIKGVPSTPFRFNIYILFMSAAIVLSDRIYFMSLNIPASLLSIVVPLRKISVFISAIIGGIIFKEKNLKSKSLCIILLILGIAILFYGK